MAKDTTDTPEPSADPAPETAAPSIEDGGTVTGPALTPLKRGEVVVPRAGFWQPNATLIEGEWSGFPQFRCSLCPYDSLERMHTQAHISTHGQTFTE